MIHERTIATAPLLEDSLLSEQIASESDAIAAGVRRYHNLAKQTIERGDGASLKPIERMMRHWFIPLREVIRREQRQLRVGKGASGSHLYGAMLLAIDADRAAFITMHEALSSCLKNPSGVYRTKLWFDIGNAIAAEVNLDALKENDSKDHQKLMWSAKRMTPQRANRWARRTLAEASGGRSACTSLGNLLFWSLIDVATCADHDKSFVPAFTMFNSKTHRRKREHSPAKMVGLSDAAWAIIEQGHSVREVMRPRYLPMLVPPYPWQTKGDVPGGYVRIRSPLTAKPTPEQSSALKKATLDGVYAGLTAVSATPWNVNERILEVMKLVWDNGGNEVGVPHRDNHQEPPLPSGFHDDPDIKKAWKREAAIIHKKNIQLRSDRMHFLQKLGIADKFKGRRVFFPHWLCFRGRSYPIPLYLNHQGDDICRGLLEFADAKPCSEGRPLAWLYVHAANCYGHDKLSFKDRIQWTHDAYQQIAQAASDPLGTIGWWGEADKPWQFLAACMAVVDPQKAARLPIQRDGTANGLQHYSAMGRDARGAAAVNMVASDKPSDVYTDGAMATLEIVQADADAGHPIAQRVESLVARGLVKQPFMTTSYGVTAVGIRKQVQKYLESKGLEGDECYKAARYLQDVIQKAIGTVCVAAQTQMDWIQTCAKAITKAGHLVQWTTPLGLPVVQPYRTGKRVKVAAKSGSFEIRDHGGRVKSSKHINSAAPNFVHSLDGTHLMMTAMECQKADITFAAVHDSYWTHAATVDAMDNILRTEFVKLHTPDLLNDLRDQWIKLYPGVEIPNTPPRGDFELTSVLSSTYFFS